MINIDGIEYRTAAQWEKKHRHVLKGQLKKGVERSWRSPNGNETMMFYNIEQTRPWAKKGRRGGQPPPPRRRQGEARRRGVRAHRGRRPRGTASQRPSRLLGGSHRRGNPAGGSPRPHRLPVVRSRLRPDCRGPVAAHPIRRQFRMVLLLPLGCAL